MWVHAPQYKHENWGGLPLWRAARRCSQLRGCWQSATSGATVSICLGFVLFVCFNCHCACVDLNSLNLFSPIYKLCISYSIQVFSNELKCDFVPLICKQRLMSTLRSLLVQITDYVKEKVWWKWCIMPENINFVLLFFGSTLNECRKEVD